MAAAAVDEVVARHAELRKTGGRMVVEVRPALDWDKGRAVLYLLDALDFEPHPAVPLDLPSLCPLYLGDDLTDEDAFRALAGRGIGILVAAAPRASAATYQLSGPEEVRRFLANVLVLTAGRGRRR